MRVVDWFSDNIRPLLASVVSLFGINLEEIKNSLLENSSCIFMSDAFLKPMIAFVFVKLLDYIFGKKITEFFDRIKSYFK